MFDVSLIPVLVSTILAVFIGMVWYSDRFFGRVWRREARIDPHALDVDGTAKLLLASVFQNFVIIFILSHFLVLANAYPNAGPLFGAVWASILVATAHLSSVIWEQRSLPYYAITTGYLVTVILSSAAVLTLWPWA